MNRNLTITITTAVVIGLAAFTGGCNQDPNFPPYGAKPDPIGPNAYPQIVVDQMAYPFLAVVYERVIVDQPNGERPLAVQVPVRALNEGSFGMQYEYIWFDAQGREVGRTGQIYANMDGRMERAIRGNAMTLAATSWRLELRLALAGSPVKPGASSEP